MKETTAGSLLDLVVQHGEARGRGIDAVTATLRLVVCGERKMSEGSRRTCRSPRSGRWPARAAGPWDGRHGCPASHGSVRKETLGRLG